MLRQRSQIVQGALAARPGKPDFRPATDDKLRWTRDLTTRDGAPQGLRRRTAGIETAHSSVLGQGAAQPLLSLSGDDD
jgi:hypothetical protein